MDQIHAFTQILLALAENCHLTKYQIRVATAASSHLEILEKEATVENLVSFLKAFAKDLTNPGTIDRKNAVSRTQRRISRCLRMAEDQKNRWENSSDLELFVYFWTNRDQNSLREIANETPETVLSLVLSVPSVLNFPRHN